MVSGFRTPAGRLWVLDCTPYNGPLKENNWPPRRDLTQVRDAMQLLEFRKDNYRTGNKMVDHPLQTAFPIFKIAFSGCEALFAFGNA